MDVENVFSNLARARNERSEIVPTSAWCCWRATHNECIVLLALFARSLVASHSSFLSQGWLARFARSPSQSPRCRSRWTEFGGEGFDGLREGGRFLPSLLPRRPSRIHTRRRIHPEERKLRRAKKVRERIEWVGLVVASILVFLKASED